MAKVTVIIIFSQGAQSIMKMGIFLNYEMNTRTLMVTPKLLKAVCVSILFLYVLNEILRTCDIYLDRDLLW